MFDHVTIRADDRSASADFYRTVLGALEIAPTREDRVLIGWDDFAIIQADREHGPTRGLHTGFVAPSRAHVDAFWRAGVQAGYRDDGPPGERRQYKPNYYGAFLLDPDGNSAEAVHHDDCRRGGTIDHLWIRVRDRARARAFYASVAPHTGLRLRGGSGFGEHVAGAWATFTLVQDERPVTENLHLAFPAPDRRTVEDFHRAALAAGYRDNGPPGERPHYHPGYYAAFALDPDGTNVESVFRGP